MKRFIASFLSYGIAILFALGGLFFHGATAYALTITPIRMELSADPGQKITRDVTLYNERDTPETFYTSYANFEAQGESGAPSFVDPKYGIGTWISAEEKIVIPPKTARTIPFTITVPSAAEPGGHFGAIFWGTAAKTNGAGEVSIGAKTGFLVLLSISGNISEKGGIVDFSTMGKQRFYTSLPVHFVYRFENAGSDRIKPSGEVRIRNTIGITTTRIEGNPVDGNVLPRSTRRFEPVWMGKDIVDEDHPYQGEGFFAAVKHEWRNFALGRYTAKLDLTYGTQNEITTAAWSFWVFPWQLLMVVILVLISGFFVFRAAFIRYNRWVIGKAEHMLEEQLESKKEHTLVHRVMKSRAKKGKKKE